MKSKLLVVVMLISSLFMASKSNALEIKPVRFTQGNYLNINFLKRAYEESRNVYEGSVNALGVSYAYAFNYDGMFIAPEAYYDFSDAKVEKEKIKDNYGMKLNLGSDLNSSVAIFANAGYEHNNGKRIQIKRDSFVYGAGVKYQANEYISLKAEMNWRTASKDVETLKLGLGFSF